jgi:23S rRNA (adenine2503-C2)-methyltransferase
MRELPSPPMQHDAVFGMTFPAFSAVIAEQFGYDQRFHRALYRQIMTTGTCQPALLAEWQEAEENSPGICRAVQELFSETKLPRTVQEMEAHDPTLGTTRKMVLQLADGKTVETVLIPMGSDKENGGHVTVCVSSQVGCRMGCRFCHTATMGLLRHLSAHEIVAQVVAIARHFGVMPRNVVFMGMGEPLDNIENVAQAVAILTDHAGLRIAPRHITISTVGRIDGLRRLPELGLARVNIAISLTAADDELRSSLMPVNNLYNLATLKQTLLEFPLISRQRFLISYVLLAGINDSDERIEQLIAWCRGIPVMVNLIPFNPIPSRDDVPSTETRIAAIRAQLMAAGVHVRVRQTKGDAVMAACGQLGDPALRARLREQASEIS